jgi:phosphate transport system permease protein
MNSVYLAALVALVLAAFVLGRNRAVVLTSANKGKGVLHSLPVYHGLLAAASVFTAMLLIYAVGTPLTEWLARTSALAVLPGDIAADDLKRGAALRDIASIAAGRQSMGTATPILQEAAQVYTRAQSIGIWSVLGAGVALALGALGLILSRIDGLFRARNLFERFVLAVLIACALIAILTTVGIIFSVVTETWRFFFDPAIKGKPSILEFLFGTDWNPQAALRADQGDIQTAYGFVPLLVGTLLITLIAMCVAGPIGLLSAIYLSEYASPAVRAFFKPVLETLAGIPTVVLGFFAALTVAPFIRTLGESAGLNVASESALAAGLVMGMMIIPFISSLSDDVINAVPQAMRDGSYALGSTKSETIRKVVLAAALPGIVSAFMLAISRAIGETMIVVMAAGLAANLTLNPLDAVTTITVQIKTILVGDQEFDSAKTLAAFALGFVLFFVTLALNYIALRIVKAYREQYE